MQKEKLDAGASLVQVWTGFIYEGPNIVKEYLNIGSSPPRFGHSPSIYRGDRRLRCQIRRKLLISTNSAGIYSGSFYT